MNRQDIMQALQFRHACKEFDPTRKIDAQDFNLICEAARLSPSSFGFEFWQFVRVSTPALREELRALACNQVQITSAAEVIIALNHTGKNIAPDSDYLKNLLIDDLNILPEYAKMRLDFYQFFIDKLFKLQTEEQKAAWTARQTYIPFANMMTVAAMLGIDSCPIEGFDKAGVEHMLAQHTPFKPEDYQAAYIVAFGYRLAEPSRAKTRRSPEKVFMQI